VVRAWQVPVASVLAGGLGTLPLAPLADLSEIPLPGVIAQMKVRLASEAAPGEAGRLWTAAYVLMGLRYPAELISQLLEGVREMEESVTYQAIIRRGREEGRVEEARQLLRRLGGKRFGPPSVAVQAALDAIPTVERLEQLSERLLDGESWEELLAS
jgi:predicted transposase YdaD